MVPFSEQGLRCIAFNRRGHGRSDDPGSGYDIDTLADDLAALLAQLDLREVTLVGKSMSSGEIAHYLSRHGTSRIARFALVSPSTPCILQRADNPEGAPRVALEALIAALHKDRPLYFADGGLKYFGLGSKWPTPEDLSSEMVQWAIRLILETSPKALIECMRTNWETDFRPIVSTKFPRRPLRPFRIFLLQVVSYLRGKLVGTGRGRRKRPRPYGYEVASEATS